MEAISRMTTKGQLTVPKSVREALGLEAGSAIVFRVEGQRAVMAQAPDLLDLAGSVNVPVERRGKAWSEIVATTHEARAQRRA